MGWLILRLARPAQRLRRAHRHTGSIHLHVQDGYSFADHDGQIQLHGALHRRLLALRNVGSDLLRRALHRLGCHLQASQHFHLLAAVIERSVRSYRRQHAAHTRGEFLVHHIQCHIGGELPFMTLRTKVIRTRDTRRAEHGQDGLGTEALIVRLMAARTRHLTVLRSRGVVLQQLAQGGCPGRMQRAPQGVLGGFQIDSTVLPTLRKDAAQPLIYFPRHFLMDRSSRFFPAPSSRRVAARRGAARRFLR